MQAPARCLLLIGLLTGAAAAQDRNVQPGVPRGEQPHVRTTSMPSSRAGNRPSVLRPTGGGNRTKTAAGLQRRDQAVRQAAHAEPAAQANAEDRLPLRRVTDPRRVSSPARRSQSGRRTTLTVVSSLAIVMAAFFTLLWISRKAAPKGLSPLPNEVVESLGRAPLTARQQMHLVRIGNKLVLLSVTANGVESLTEITDTDEVTRLCGLCQQGRSGSISHTFRQVLSQYAREPAPGGFAGDPRATQLSLANRAAFDSRYAEEDGA